MQIPSALGWPHGTTRARARPHPPHAAGLDGRSLRAGRTREAIVDALFALLEDGEVQPTGDQIAERAGVSLRSVFLHFQGREQLFAAITERQVARIAPLFEPLDASAPLAARIDAFCEQRARVLEAVTPLRRAAVLMEPRSEVVARKLARGAGGKARPGGVAVRPRAGRLPRRRAQGARPPPWARPATGTRGRAGAPTRDSDPAAARAAMRLTLRRLLGAG